MIWRGPAPWQRAVKRTLDVALGGLLLIICLPVLLISIVVLKLSSSGPALYRQARVGEGGQLFWMFKLHTMIPDADQQVVT
jgi:lipopolysaccharide/colanic/teichoic acid biosynthesis glycosyltransferase